MEFYWSIRMNPPACNITEAFECTTKIFQNFGGTFDVLVSVIYKSIAVEVMCVCEFWALIKEGKLKLQEHLSGHEQGFLFY